MYDGTAGVIKRTFVDGVETVVLSTDWTDASPANALGRVELSDGVKKNLAGVIIDISDSSESVVRYSEGHVEHFFSKPDTTNMM